MLCQNWVQIWNPLGKKSTKRAIINDPVTYGYKVMVESNSGKRPSWIWRISALAPSKNEFSMFWPTSVPNFMLVDKSAQYLPKNPLGPGLYDSFENEHHGLGIKIIILVLRTG